MMLRISLGLMLGLALQACAFFGKSDPLVPRYFTPDGATAQGQAPGSAGSQELRLGRVIGSDHLRERIAFRKKDGELGYREGLRWTERPEEFVRRALASALFEQRGVARVMSGAAPTLDVELIAFEEVRDGRDEPLARIQLVAVLQDGRFARFEQTFTVDEPVTADDSNAKGSPQALVRALSRALARCVAQVGDGVLRHLPTVSSEGSDVVSSAVGEPGAAPP